MGGSDWENVQLQRLLDHTAVRETVVRYFYALDVKDWALCRSCFTDTIEVDYADLRGDPPSVMAVDEFVEKRRLALTPLRTLHQNTNHLIAVQANEATCLSNAAIYRWGDAAKADNSFHTFAMYTHQLISTAQGWKIARVRQSVVANVGNADLHQGVTGTPSPSG